MPCEVHKDERGHFYRIKEEPEFPEIDAWWSREAPNKKLTRDRFSTHHSEHFVIRQDNGEDHADVVVLTLGQVYDMIHALNKAVENI